MKNKALIIPAGIFVLLILAWLFFEYRYGQQGRTTLPDDLIAVDSSSLHGIDIREGIGSDPVVELKKFDKSWRVYIGNDVWADTDEEQMHLTLRHLNRLRPESLAATSENDHQRLGVDREAILITLKHEGREDIEFYVGDYDFRDKNRVVSYFRKFGDHNVYGIQDYLTASLGETDLEAWRNPKLMDLSPEKINRLSFSFAEQEDYFLEKENSVWKLNNEQSVNINRFNEWVDNFDEVFSEDFINPDNYEQLSGPVASLTILKEEEETIKGYLLNDEFVLSSDANHQNYFRVEEEFFKLLFTPPERFY